MWRRCLLVLSACRELSWRSDRVNFSVVCLTVGWTCVHDLWCYLWLYSLSFEGIIYLLRPQFSCWVPSQRQLYLYITDVPPLTRLIYVEFHGFLCWLEYAAVMTSRVSLMVFPARLLFSLQGRKWFLDGRVLPCLNRFVLMIHWPWFDLNKLKLWVCRLPMYFCKVGDLKVKICLSTIVLAFMVIHFFWKIGKVCWIELNKDALIYLWAILVRGHLNVEMSSESAIYAKQSQRLLVTSVSLITVSRCAIWVNN